MFKKILETIVDNCSGGVGAVLMGYDGISIDQYVIAENPLDLNLVGIEYSNVIKEVASAAEILNIGDLQELSIKTDHYYVIIHALTDDYFVALLVDRCGNYGQGRYLLMRESHALRAGLE
ncbi:Predicted regulator of Ras-like GTPase activity, Roadblock/LC7/MglB family [Desulfuromusa kysingii]|uniref:Predicted regulator of Ras-like GTPase activity, Roadblock/LC7/MglB family n=1 Tax=Desulfuromusa kysingii TaxID=37625 RepID=A0A1H4CYJ7_9BACT|nr:GTPase [Desulfuromusa kysingii]SEA65316.1 Predicted regulator of Ras-like GTPase activity, Roadblock/LC7/MglB family [Desulfuromusa kysingii]